MKTFKLISASLLLILVLFSCSSDDNNNEALSCDDAILATADAAAAFNDATPGNYADRCNDYKQALENQIESCGDADGFLQAIIDDLGDCTIDTSNGVVSVTVGTLNKTFETNITVTVAGTTRKVRAEDNATSDWIYFEIQQGATGNDVISNFNIHLISSDYNPLPDDEGGNWSSNISVNTATNINGTFFGYVTSPTSGADLELTSGIIDVDL